MNWSIQKEKLSDNTDLSGKPSSVAVVLLLFLVQALLSRVNYYREKS